ncbi:MAG: hypothetical protein E4H03_02255 [Myxococcales bacterium]|nr:MAG: hypothetical protein E4H03_02255 [Myxococcales bacterium]
MKVINLIVVAVSLSTLCAATSVVQAEGQRYDRRSSEMAMPDPVLDPFHQSQPIALPPASAEPVPDSVDREEFDPDEEIDETEREVYESYLIEQGLKDDPHDHLRRDAWDGSSGEEAEIDDGGYSDPVEW